ncbi:hypothetical protein [Pyxidicoccus caerfyrddinensis]|uniref:hypothetical protein n=1 Tax=Pyxidicoccus caerfyrddinensis TaxID=2709663 RepID=UPI0013DABF8E|nr:hypothetical protein [Pyxidicoccus caerfyrddinensis]
MQPRIPPFVPSDYTWLSGSEVLRPADLVTIGAGLAWCLEMKREDLSGWYRPLGLALFERLGLTGLPQYRAVAEETRGPELLRALGVAEGFPNRSNALGRAWMFRASLLAFPDHASGVLEGHPYQLAIFNRGIPEALKPLAEQTADALIAHCRAANELARELDRAIVALWGCPLEWLDAQVTVAELVAAGLALQTFEP